MQYVLVNMKPVAEPCEFCWRQWINEHEDERIIDQTFLNVPLSGTLLASLLGWFGWRVQCVVTTEFTGEESEPWVTTIWYEEDKWDSATVWATLGAAKIGHMAAVCDIRKAAERRDWRFAIKCLMRKLKATGAATKQIGNQEKIDTAS